LKAQEHQSWATQPECERHLGLTDWNRSFVLESVIRRLQQPPLSSQSGNAERLQVFQRELSEWRGRLDGAAAAKAREEYAAEIGIQPEDYYLRESFADFLEGIGDFHQAELQWREVQGLIPQDFLAWFQIGRMLVKQNRMAEASAALVQALTLRPSLAEGWLELGRVQATSKEFEQAVDSFNRACRLRPQDPVPISYKGKALSNLNRKDEAVALYRQAIQLNPSYWEAHNALADELASAGKSSEAADEYEIVLRQNPGFAMGHLNLGVMLVKMGRMDEAQHQFEEALRLEPENKTARQYLLEVQARKQSQRHN